MIPERILKMLEMKRIDYSYESKFQVFEYISQKEGVTTNQAIRLMLWVKIARLKNLLANKLKPNFESISDTWDDLMGYLIILFDYNSLKFPEITESTEELKSDDALEQIERLLEDNNIQELFKIVVRFLK